MNQSSGLEKPQGSSDKIFEEILVLLNKALNILREARREKAILIMMIAKPKDVAREIAKQI